VRPTAGGRRHWDHAAHGGGNDTDFACDRCGKAQFAVDRWWSGSTQKAALVTCSPSARRLWQRTAKGTTGAGGMDVNGLAAGSTDSARVAGYLVRSSAPTSRIAVKHTATGRRARTRRSSGLPGYAEACQVWGRGLIGSTRLAVVGEVATTTWSHLAGVPWLRR
jgi:hypothetical protein